MDSELPAYSFDQYPTVQTRNIPGLERILVPPAQLPSTIRQPNRAQRATNDKYKSNTVVQKTNPVPLARPWWMRLLVDAMLVPFIQGFMLNIGTHWVRHWRNSGGLISLFRKKRK